MQPIRVLKRIYDSTIFTWIIFAVVSGLIVFSILKETKSNRGPASDCGNSYSCHFIDPRYEKVYDFPDHKRFNEPSFPSYLKHED